MENPENLRLKKARKKVEDLKGFYNHLLVYGIVNIVLFVVRGDVLQFFQNQATDKIFMEWIDWNILVVPIFWGIGLLFHASKVFQYKLKFIKNWEDRQIVKFMDNE